ncbi:hypothetical protein B0H12DRAFT_1241238 [Mycena haematopus]|nr:hypothetical protein B0H12DRAFT_1241238 [Mycena haematopus]
MPSGLRRTRSTRITSDAFAATTVTLRAIQASTDAFPPLKSAVSAVLVVLELSEKAKSNKKGCEHIAKRSAQLVQDIWGQTKDFDDAIPLEAKESIVQIEKLVEEIKTFLEELRKENLFQRFVARADLYSSMPTLLPKSAAADHETHTAVLDVSKMSEAERLQLLTQIRNKVYDLGKVHMGTHVAIWTASLLLRP